jgi:hypothetical protein
VNRPWLFLTFVIPCLAQPSLSPAAFPELLDTIRADLQRRKCKIPQLLHEKRVNVIRGEFAKRGQRDWAVLCETGRVSSILIFWKGSEINPARISEQPNEARYELNEKGDKENIRVISPVGRREIMTHYGHSGGLKPPPIDHQGIDDALAGKASVINYLYNGKWIGLTGAD